jgi:hypothetical protein
LVGPLERNGRLKKIRILCSAEVFLDIDPGDTSVGGRDPIEFAAAVTNVAILVHRAVTDANSRCVLEEFAYPAITKNLGWDDAMLGLWSAALAQMEARKGGHG